MSVDCLETVDIEWRGQTFRRHPGHPNRSLRVYFMATSAPREYLHRAIYKAHSGPIPAGWHVHHVDHDPLNNDPANLQAVSPTEHATHHGRHIPEILVVCACGMEFSARRPWAKWCSPACKEAHRRAAGLVKQRPRKGAFTETRRCEECGAAYQASRPWQRFDSSPCKQRWGRRNG